LSRLCVWRAFGQPHYPRRGLQSGLAEGTLTTRMKTMTRQPAKRVELGKHIVADPEICHGQPTYKGTRIMVWIVLEQLDRGMTWKEIMGEWNGKVCEEAISETIAIAHLVEKHEPFRGFNVSARRKPARRATAIAA